MISLLNIGCKQNENILLLILLTTFHHLFVTHLKIHVTEVGGVFITTGLLIFNPYWILSLRPKVSIQMTTAFITRIKTTLHSKHPQSWIRTHLRLLTSSNNSPITKTS